METLRSNDKTSYNHTSEVGDTDTCVDEGAGIGKGHLKVIKSLIEHGGDIKNNNEPNPLTAAELRSILDIQE